MLWLALDWAGARVCTVAWRWACNGSHQSLAVDLAAFGLVAELGIFSPSLTTTCNICA